MRRAVSKAYIYSLMLLARIWLSTYGMPGTPESACCPTVNKRLAPARRLPSTSMTMKTNHPPPSLGTPRTARGEALL